MADLKEFAARLAGKSTPQNSYSAMYAKLTEPKELTDPQGVTDLGTMADIRERASLEGPSIEGPRLGGRSDNSSGAGQVMQQSLPPKPQTLKRAGKLSLEEQANQLEQQMNAQNAALQASPIAVDPSKDLGHAHAYFFGDQ